MPLLIIIMLLITALFVFTKLYRIALAWFVRSRIDRRWEAWASVMTAAASLPLASISSFFIVSFFNFLAQLAAKAKTPIPGLGFYLEIITGHENLLLLLFIVLFMARMVPQTIADSKIFAYSVEFNSSALRSEDNVSR